MILDVDPKVDYAFKHLFGRDQTRPILIDVIDSVLDPPAAHRIRDIELQNPFNAKEALDHVLFPDVPDYHLRFRLLEEKHHLAWTDDIEVHVLELPKFTKSAEQLQTRLDRWLYFLRNAAMMDTEAIPEGLRQPLVLRALEELQMLTRDELERERYEARRKAQLDLTSSLYAARVEGLEEGLQQGLERGRLEGREEGRLEGREEGRLEGREEGRLEAREEGEKQGIIRAIQVCEDLLKRPETPRADLTSQSLDVLVRWLDDLQAQLRNQR